jgi:hypothetical protein
VESPIKESRIRKVSILDGPVFLHLLNLPLDEKYYSFIQQVSANLDH